MDKIRKALAQNRGTLVTDFDGTLTLSGSSLQAPVRVLGENSALSRARDELYHSMGKEILDQFLAGKKDRVLMERAELWWREQIRLYVEFGISPEILARAAALLPPRPEAAALLRFCVKNRIPVWIVSAGLENVIRFWLGQQEIDDTEIHVLANRILYREEIPEGCTEPVTVWNKGERFFSQAGKEAAGYLVFLGDQEEDLMWRKERAEGFLIK